MKLHYYQALRLVQTSILLTLSSCALWSESSTSLPIPLDNYTGAWRQVQESPYVYEHTDELDRRTFLTGIRECEGARPRSPAEAARQLLVGLKDIRIEERQEVKLSDMPALRSRVRAKLEDRPLELLTYTLTRDTCVYDFVLWQPVDETSEPMAVEPLLERADVVARALNLLTPESVR